MVAPKEKTTTAISLRLTEDERSWLEQAASGRGMSAFIRDRLFGAEARKTQIRVPNSNARQLAHILAALGQSGISASLREMENAARTGTLELDIETREALTSACRVVERIRADLLTALGLSEGADE